MNTAGLMLALVGAADLPLERPTASDPGPGFGLLAGWEIPRDKVTIQPELGARVNTAGPAIDVPVGISAVWGGPFAVGVQGHLTVPVLYVYPFPGGDLGGQVAYRPDNRFRASLRVGYDLAWTIRYKCACPQPSQHWLAAEATVGIRF